MVGRKWEEVVEAVDAWAPLELRALDEVEGQLELVCGPLRMIRSV